MQKLYIQFHIYQKQLIVFFVLQLILWELIIKIKLKKTLPDDKGGNAYGWPIKYNK